MNITDRPNTQLWTIYSLRPPTSADVPFNSEKTKLIVSGELSLHPLPVISSALSRTIKRFGHLPVEAELNHLCRSYNTEILSAIAEGLKHSEMRSKIRNKTGVIDHNINVPAKNKSDKYSDFVSKHFINIQRKYHSIDLNAELKRLKRSFPSEALTLIERAIRSTLNGHLRRGRPRLQGFAGPSAEVRMFVQDQRLNGYSDIEIARCLESKLEAGQSRLGLRKRAQREVAAVHRTSSSGQVTLAVATELWAIARAQRQVEIVAKRTALTEEQQIQWLMCRRSRFMSRASQQTTL